MIRKAVIPAAGFGTRMLPAAKAVPKEMLPVLDRPAIQYVVEECAAAGADDVLLVTSRDKKAVEDHFDRSPELEARLAASGKEALLASVNELTAAVQVHAVRQPEQRGLGDAVYQAKRHVGKEPFLCLLGDTIFSVRSSGTGTVARRGMPALSELKGRPIGRVLTKMGLVTREQVIEALERQKTQREPLGALLILMGHVTAGDVEAALAAQRGEFVKDRALPAAELLEAYARVGTSVIGLEEVPPEKVSRYGIVGGTRVGDGRVGLVGGSPDVDDLYQLDQIVEKPSVEAAPSRLAVAARYVLTPAIFECLEHTQPGKGGEVQLTDALQLLLKREPVHGILLKARRHDIGNPLDWLKTNLLFASRDAATWESLRPAVQSLLSGDDSGG